MDLFSKQESLKPYFEKSYGWAVFGHLGKIAIFFVGGAGGQGDVYINQTNSAEGAKRVGTTVCAQINGGFQLGGTMYAEIIFFEDESAFKSFTSGNFEFKGEAQAVGITASASVGISTLGNQGLTAGITADGTHIGEHECKYVKGMKIYTITLGGLMYQAAIAGQKFWYTPLEEEKPKEEETKEETKE